MATAPHRDETKETAHPHGADTAHAAPKAETKAEPKAEPKAATPRDASADQAKMLMLLTGDWLNNDRTHQAEIAALHTSLTAALAPPVNVDVPFVSQSGGTLSCTMGNWRGEPSSYAYAWHNDGVANGATGATYTVTPEDSGHGLACVVTATNALGSTVAPMSNAVVI
jgi:hypothetical protein